MSRGLLERLQRSLGEVAGAERETVRVAPFTAYVDRERPLKYFSFALPDPGTAELPPELTEVFAERDRTARVEHFEELNPHLREALEAAGWSLSERAPVMACTPEALVVPPAPDGLVLERVGPDAAEPLVRALLAAQKTAFEDPHGVGEADVTKLRAWAAEAPVFAGLIDGEVVGAGLASKIARGVAEVAGVATLPAFRRRGIAAAITAAAAAAAFEAGAELAWLTAADEDAARLYGRAGFALTGTMWAYDAPS